MDRSARVKVLLGGGLPILVGGIIIVLAVRDSAWAGVLGGAIFLLAGLLIILGALGAPRSVGAPLAALLLSLFAAVSFVALPPSGILVGLLAGMAWLHAGREVVTAIRGRDPLEGWSQEKVFVVGVVGTAALGVLVALGVWFFSG